MFPNEFEHSLLKLLTPKDMPAVGSAVVSNFLKFLLLQHLERLK